MKKIILSVACLSLGIANAGEISEFTKCMDNANRFYITELDKEVEAHTKGKFTPNDSPKTNITYVTPTTVLVERSYDGTLINVNGQEVKIESVITYKELPIIECVSK